MTEDEWIACDHPEPMLEFLRGKASDRKLRVLVVACARRIWNLMPAPSRTAIEVLELYADGAVTTAEYDTAMDRAVAEAFAADRDPPDTLTYAAASAGVSSPPTLPSVSSALDTAATALGCLVAENVPEDEYDRTYDHARRGEVGEQSRLLRDIFGNPFRPVSVAPAWRTSDVMLLAGASTRIGRSTGCRS
jgi:hypothetical protein